MIYYNSTVLEFLRVSSDHFVSEAIQKLKESIASALSEFGCPPPEADGGWFHPKAQGILQQLGSQNPEVGWPTWIWDYQINTSLGKAFEQINPDGEFPGLIISPYLPIEARKSTANCTVGSAELSVSGSVFTIMNTQHVQISEIQLVGDGEIPPLGEPDLAIIKEAIQSQAELDQTNAPTNLGRVLEAAGKAREASVKAVESEDSDNIKLYASNASMEAGRARHIAAKAQAEAEAAQASAEVAASTAAAAMAVATEAAVEAEAATEAADTASALAFENE